MTNFRCDDCLIRNRSLCSSLTAEDLNELNAIGNRLKLSQEQAAFYEGDDGVNLYAITSGVMRLSKMLKDGRRQVTGFLFPGDLMGFAFSGNYAYSADAVTSAELCRFPRARLNTLIEHSPELERRLLALASNELAAAQEHIVLLGRKNARERLASFLLALGRKSEEDPAPDGYLSIPMTRADIADYLGLTIETISRVLAQFKEERLIDLPRPHQFRVLDLDRLKETSGDDT